MAMTQKKANAFKAELKALLSKYGVSIGLTASSCSDWHGISCEAIAISDSKGDEVRLNEGNWLHAGEL